MKRIKYLMSGISSIWKMCRLSIWWRAVFSISWLSPIRTMRLCWRMMDVSMRNCLTSIVSWVCVTLPRLHRHQRQKRQRKCWRRRTSIWWSVCLVMLITMPLPWLVTSNSWSPISPVSYWLLSRMVLPNVSRTRTCLSSIMCSAGWVIRTSSCLSSNW